MKIAGVICEYNPFHRGHAYHLAETRARTGCDYIVACMTGSFVQRGEAACLSKWTRAEMALRSGADAVFELPALYAIRTADVFARGGVAILSGIGADVLSFGSETADMHLLESIAELRENRAGLRLKRHSPRTFRGQIPRTRAGRSDRRIPESES